MADVHMKIERGFKAVMSRGDDVPLDPQEVAVVQRAAEEGAIVRVKSGFINPSFLVSIVEDKKRFEIFLDDTRHRDEERKGGMKPLPDILARSFPQLGPGHE